MDTDETRRKRLKFRAWRRGFREADLILGPFADSHVDGFGSEQLAVFERLLDVPDQDFYEWIVERTPTPPEFDGEVIGMIKAFRHTLNQVRGDDRGA